MLHSVSCATSAPACLLLSAFGFQHAAFAPASGIQHSAFTSSIGLSPLLGAFVWPALFSAGAACAAIPIIIHLLARRRFRKIRWAAIEFLLEAQRRNQKRVRLEEWILLALRCLAMVLIALLVARFFMRPQGMAQSPIGAARTDHILLMDDSFSTGLRLDDGGTVFDRVKQAARQIVESVHQGGAEDTVSVVRLTDPSEPLVAGASVAADEAQHVLSRLAGMAVSQERINLAAGVQRVRDDLDAHPDVLSAVVYVLSDFQAGDWLGAGMNAGLPERRGSAAGERSDAAATAGVEHVLSPLKNWIGQERSLRVVLVNVGPPRAANLAIHDPQVAFGVPVVGSAVRLSAKVSNFGDAPAENVEVRAIVGETVTSAQTLPRVAAGQTASVEIETTFPSAGEESVRLEIAHDRLEIDDTAHLATQVLNAVRVLLVDGEPSSDAFLDEVHLLATAMRPEGDVFSGNEVTVIDAAALESTDLERYHAVVLANVAAVSDSTAAALARFTAGGGGVMVFLGDQVDPQSYNVQLGGARGLLPARLGEAVVASDRPRGLVVGDPLHPAMAGVSREGDPLGLGMVRFSGFFACEIETPESSPPGVSAPEGGDEEPAPTADSSVRVLAVYQGDEGYPAIVEKRAGAGRVVLFTSSADKEWNTWPDSPTYLPVCLEMVTHVARRGAVSQVCQVGGPIEVTVDSGDYEASAFLHTPAYPNEAEMALSAAPLQDGRSWRFGLERARQAGVYRFLLRSREDRDETRLVAVNVEPDESDLTPAREEELRAAMPDIPLEYVASVEQLRTLAPDSRTEWWPAFLVAAAAVLMLEQTLAWFFGRRGNVVATR
ncbi:MAG: BatA domain-containing protein [Phycisphaerales bacterium]|nr:BatA domain-containing protein [Phycisphaerales bacterium]